MYLYNQFLLQFNISDETASVISLSFALGVLLALVLRVVVFIGYQIQYSTFKLNAKDLKAKSEISSIKSGIAAKIIKDYARSCEKGVSRISADAITKKHLLRLRFLYWTFDSISRFVSSIEGSIILVGVLLAVFTDYPMFFGVFSIILFIVDKILAATFDYEHAYQKLETEIAEYLEREIGQFFVLDLNSGLTRLNTSMRESSVEQAAVMNDAIKALGTDLSGVLKLVVGDIRKNIEDTVNTINSYSDVLKKPLDEWREAVGLATESQKSINSATEALKSAALDFSITAKSAESSFAGYIVKLENEKDYISSQIETLRSISLSASENLELYSVNKQSLDTALKYIEKNQTTLEDSLGKYELALEGLTAKLGDALGSILNYHIGNSYGSLNTALTENLDSILKSNSDLSTRLQRLFEDMTEHMKSQLQTVINLKEQIDLQFETLNRNTL